MTPRRQWPAAWSTGVLLVATLALAYVLARPPSADLAAATYRSGLFKRAGFVLWDNAWYAGHHVPGYSLLAPALGALLGPVGLLAICTVVAGGLFGWLAGELLAGPAARLASTWAALNLGVGLLSGRVPFALGLALALGTLLALQRQRRMLTLGLAAATGLASPVAAAFLALIALATALAGYGPRRAALAAGAAALAPALALAVAFPEGGYEPYPAAAFWPVLGAVLAIAVVVSRAGLPSPGRRVLVVGCGLYAGACTAAYLIHTPVGGNVNRLGALLAGPLVAATLWPRHRRLLALCAPLLLYWGLVSPLRDLVVLAPDPAVSERFYAPLVSELELRAAGRPLRVEIPLPGAHWEADYVAAHLSLARGWERQLDTRYGALFYHPRLASASYRAWLLDQGVAYVALPLARLDGAARAEAELIDGGLPYLRLAWRSARWRLYAVVDARPLAQAPARLTALTADAFSLWVPAAGTYVVRVHHTSYWQLKGRGCVARAAGDWTAVRADAPGTLRVQIAFSLARVFARGPRCD